MDYELSPEPAGAEREALERALGELLEPEQHPAYRSAWRHAGVVENSGVFRLADLRDGASTE